MCRIETVSKFIRRFLPIILLGILCLFGNYKSALADYYTLPIDELNDSDIVLYSWFDHDLTVDLMVRYDGETGHPYDEHRGTDYSTVIEGKDIYAADEGVVRIVGWENPNDPDSGYGYRMYLFHDDNGIVGQRTVYAHLMADSNNFNEGQVVNRGNIIALSGDTGISTNPHLHFGVYKGDTALPEQQLDPYGWSGFGQDPWPHNENTYLWTTDPPSLPSETLATSTISGSITEDTTLEKGYVYLMGDTTIEKGVTLTLEPGVIVKFTSPSRKLTVRGHLSAIGTPEDKIYFTSYKDDDAGGDSNGDGGASGAEAEDWQHISVSSGAVATFENAVIRYGGYVHCNSNNVCNKPGALKNPNAVLQISDSVLSNNRHAIYMDNNGYTNISGSIITDSVEEAILIEGTLNNPTLSISDSIISNSGDFGIQVSSNGTDPTISISNSQIIGNASLGISVGGNGADMDISILNTDFKDNLGGDGGFGGYQTQLNFENYGNTTSGVGKNGFFLNTSAWGDQTWNPGVPFIVKNFGVGGSETLTIKPGVIVKFSDETSYMSIAGTLSAHGTTNSGGSGGGGLQNYSATCQIIYSSNGNAQLICQPYGKIYFTSYKDDSVGGDSNGDGNATFPASEDYRAIETHSGIIDISKAVLRYGGRCYNPYSTCNRRGVISVLGSSAEVSVESTEISNNKYGIYRRLGNQITVNHSSVKDNEVGIYYEGTGSPILAQNNWWGHITGPYNGSQNPNGQGNPVTGNVLFIPWLLEDPF